MRSVSLLDAPVTLPGSGVVTRGLVMGNRWPLAVAYLGPAWVASGMGENRVFVFVAAMLLGRLMFQILEACPASRTSGTFCPGLSHEHDHLLVNFGGVVMTTTGRFTYSTPVNFAERQRWGGADCGGSAGSV